MAIALPAAQAASPAASACPDTFFPGDNLATSPSFEQPARGVAVGASTCWSSGNPTPATSAAAGWSMDNSNGGAGVCSAPVPATVPGPGGMSMLAFRAGSNEGGVYQSHALDPTKAYMFSMWVYVRSGKVAIQSRAMTGGAVAWTSKVDEWKQLRVCTSSLSNTDMLVVFNQDPAGGMFYVDRSVLRQIPIRE